MLKVFFYRGTLFIPFITDKHNNDYSKINFSFNIEQYLIIIMSMEQLRSNQKEKYWS